MSVVAELEAGLQAMASLKPPGVSGSKITGITSLCVSNVQSESVLVQKLFTHFKKTPGTHKLGVLYVVDSVTRKWMEQAKNQGQPISSAAPDGTYAAGVHKVTDLMPQLMSDIISTAPEDQKEKIEKLVGIWEKGQTFPPHMLASFREKLSAPRSAPESTTPPGSPPANLLASIGLGSKPAPPSAMPNIMEALASIARQNTTAAQSNPSVPTRAPQYSNPGNVMPPTSAMPFMPATQPTSQAPPVSLPGMPFPYPPQPAQHMPSQMPPPVSAAATAPASGLLGALGAWNTPGGAQANPLAAFAGQPPPALPAAPPVVLPAAVDPKMQQQLALITALAGQGVPLDKIPAILSQVMGAGGGAPPAAAPLQPQLPQPIHTGYSAIHPGQGASAPWEARDHNAHPHPDSMRSPNRDRVRGRSRSRSPRPWESRHSPREGRGNNDRGYDYGQDASRGRFDDRDRDRPRGSDPYRQRSPPSRRGQSPPGREPSQGEKWVEHDPNIPAGSIKVYSRTLFVGGVTCSEAELRAIFSRYGQVQTCIVNRDKRHAFVKMYYRKDAETARAAMENDRGPDSQLRTRWGVGYGPRDCSDYQTGISIIPIHKLTEADRKWMLTAPYGGSGGRPITPGLCVEEPDIEIGAGVSSKAISRRMQTDKGGNHGPKSSRRDEEPNHAGGGRFRRSRDGGRRDGGDHRRGDDRNDRSANEEPVVLGLPPGISMGPNGINYNPGYQFGA